MQKKIKNKIIRLIQHITYRQDKRLVERFYLNKYDVDKPFIDKKLDSMLRHAVKNVPYYNNLKPNLNSFPIVTKSVFQNYGERQFMSNNRRFMGYYAMNTGGSTGEPFEFYRDVRTGIIDNIHQEIQHVKMGFTDDDILVVFNGCNITDEKIKRNEFWNKKNKNQLPFGSIEFSTHHLTKDNISYYLKKLSNIKPTYIRGYPSSMSEFTRLLMEIGLERRPFDLKGIQLSSEVCSEDQLAMLESYWGKNVVYFQYGHSEAASVASNYPSESCYVFSPYYGLVEILDEAGVHVKKGEIGRIVVTSLHNYARPIIRYDTGDMAIYLDCVDYVTTVSKILGREQDYVVDINNQRVSITSLVFGQHFKAFRNIVNWQIHNPSPGKIIVYIIKSNDWSTTDHDEVSLKLSFDNRFSVDIEFVKVIEKTKAGKNKLVIGMKDV